MILHDGNRDWQYDTIWHWPLYTKALKKKNKSNDKNNFFLVKILSQTFNFNLLELEQKKK